MPDRVKTVWARLDKKGNLKDIRMDVFTGFKKLKIRYHTPNKKGMGRAKGNKLELETAKLFSTWIYGKEGVLKRTPLSGGWASSKAGDIVLDHEMAGDGVYNPPIYVECRSYADLLQHNFFSWSETGIPKHYTEWIKEVESKCGKKLPFLVMKGNGTNIWVLMLRRWCGSYPSAPRIVFRTKKYKGALFPLYEIALPTMSGEGKSYLKEWKSNGGSPYLRRHC